MVKKYSGNVRNDSNTNSGAIKLSPTKSPLLAACTTISTIGLFAGAICNVVENQSTKAATAPGYLVLQNVKALSKDKYEALFSSTLTFNIVLLVLAAYLIILSAWKLIRNVRQGRQFSKSVLALTFLVLIFAIQLLVLLGNVIHVKNNVFEGFVGGVCYLELFITSYLMIKPAKRIFTSPVTK